MTVAQTYTQLYQPLFGTIRANADKYTKITHKNGGEIEVKPEALEATEIRDFVKNAFDDFTVMASTRLSDLYNRSFDATFHSVDGKEYTYTLSFKESN